MEKFHFKGCPGTLSNYYWHSHQTITDSAYVFAARAPDYAAEKALRSLMENGMDGKGRPPYGLPFVPRCHGLVPEDFKTRVLETMQDTGGELICEMPAPALAWSCYKGNKKCAYRDRRMEMNCKDNFHVGGEDHIMILEFNSPRNTSYDTIISRNTNAYWNMSMTNA